MCQVLCGVCLEPGPPSMAMLAVLLSASAAAGPYNGNYYGCKDSASKALKYCDKTLSDT